MPWATQISTGLVCGVETALRITDTLASERYGKDVTGVRVQDRGVGFVTSNRMEEGMAPEMSVRENFLANLRPRGLSVLSWNSPSKDAALGDARHAIVDHLRVEGPAAKRAVARMIGELHGMDRPDFHAHALQGEDRGGIADMAICDVRLDGKNVHG